MSSSQHLQSDPPLLWPWQLEQCLSWSSRQSCSWMDPRLTSEKLSRLATDLHCNKMGSTTPGSLDPLGWVRITQTQQCRDGPAIQAGSTQQQPHVCAGHHMVCWARAAHAHAHHSLNSHHPAFLCSSWDLYMQLSINLKNTTKSLSEIKHLA